MALQKNAGAVRRFAKMLKVAAWLADLPNKFTPPPFRLMQIGSLFWQSRVLYVAAQLDIATQLGDARLSAEDLATRVAAHPEAMYRLLRMLVSMGIFAETSPRQFTNNKLSSYLRTDKPHNVRAMILMHNSDTMSRPWYEQLERGVLEGAVPFELTHGETLFEYMDRDQAFDTLFAQAMDTVEALGGDSFATDFAWGQFGRVIDVGGSRGSKSVTILKHHAHLRALVVDRAHVIEAAQAFWKGREDERLLGRLQFQAGDATKAVPAARDAGDIYLLSAVLHGFDDEGAVAILRNVAQGIGDTGARVALLEMVISETGADLPSASFDMQMFMGTRGRERTAREWRRLFDRSGFCLEESVGLRSFGNILVLRRRG